jgi:formylglycine-generating enzyme required for sulfatase activity
MKRSLVLAVTLLTMTLMAGTVGAAEKKKAKKETPDSEVVTNSIGMKFVKVPAGSFMMGKRACQQPDDPFASRSAYDNCMKEGSNSEKPSHRVTISQPFLIGQYEVTQEQWYKVMGSNPAEFKTDKVGEDSRNYPVEKVSWNDVQNFISRLNAKEGKEYRLPTEAEWEYACKSGGKDQKYCGGNDLSDVAWYEDNSGSRTHRVGTKKPNGLGIYDMSGNVFEWVSDWYGVNYYGNSPDSDPQGPSGGERRVNRGGSWSGDADDARSSNRNIFRPLNYSNFIGFRLVSPPFSK